MVKGHLVLDVRKLPEVIFAVRKEFCDALRREAEAESDPRLARRLGAIAAAFEAGSAWE